ncbi:MAG: tetratricopeptide repeat protein [Agarilytica sp.]
MAVLDIKGFFFSARKYLCCSLILFSSNSFSSDSKLVENRSWVKVTSPGFEIISDASKGSVKRLAEKLERFKYAVEMFTTVKLSKDDRPVTVLAISDGRVFDLVAGDDGYGENFSGWFEESTRGNYAVIKLQKGWWKKSTRYQTSESILFHEYVHYISYFWKGEVFPKWYGEGLAEYLSTLTFKKNKGSVGLPLHYHIQFLRHNGLAPIESLLKASAYPQGEAELSLFYAQSWAFVHYLSALESRKDSLRVYLSLNSSGSDIDSAFKEAFKVDYAGMDKRLRKYLNANEFRYFEFSLDSERLEAAYEFKRLNDEEILVDVGRYLIGTQGGRDKALLMFERALEINPKYMPAMAGRVYFDISGGEGSSIGDSQVSKLEDYSGSAWVDLVLGHIYSGRIVKHNNADEISSSLANKALSAYGRAGAEATNIEAMLGIGGVYFALGRLDKALEFYEAAAMYAPSNDDVLRSLIVAYYASDRIDLAADSIYKLVNKYHLSSEIISDIDKWLDGVRDGYVESLE